MITITVITLTGITELPVEEAGTDDVLLGAGQRIELVQDFGLRHPDGTPVGTIVKCFDVFWRWSYCGKWHRQIDANY
jgi:hypothetical protein